MIDSIGDFVIALRKADVAVSPAETLDAMSAMELIGPRDRQLLHDTLSVILAKSPEEKVQFDICFDRFFSFTQFRHSSKIRANRPAGSIGTNGGGRGDEEESSASDGEDRRRQSPAHHNSRLGHLLLEGESEQLALLMTQAARAVKLERIRTLRERSLYTKRILTHMGIAQLEAEISRLAESDDDRSQETAEQLAESRQYLIEEVRGFVEDQYQQFVDGTGGRFLREAVSNVQLTTMQAYYFDDIRESVRKLAERLAKRHAKRRKVVNRGQLDVRRTLRRNLQYDGALFDLQWKQTRVERPKVFVICDVSGSVRVVSRFLLTFLYSLGEVLPRVRAFAFSNELGEVTEIFDNYPLEQAIEMSLDDYGRGSTDYGLAFKTFADLAIGDIDNRSTIIVLGDSRNNYYETGVDALRRVASKARQIIWLNPEPRDRWNEGDAEMHTYLPFCEVAEVCNSLGDLDRMVSRVLRSSH